MPTGVYERTEYHRKRLAKGQTGRKLSLETRKKLSKLKTGLKHTAETKKKIGDANRGRIHTEEHKRKVREQISGEKNYLWKGENVSYRNLHRWVRKYKGEPKKCEHCGDESKLKYDWANISGMYFRDLDDFIALCRSCHKRYDIGGTNHGRSHTTNKTRA